MAPRPDPPDADPAHPDPDATGVPGGDLTTPPGSPGRESRERSAAREREAARRRMAGEEGRDTARKRAAVDGNGEDAGLDEASGGEDRGGSGDGRDGSELACGAFVALAESAHAWAIFLMDEDGIIVYWGEGARRIKRWRKESAEGAHLRILYPDGGSEDGTAESHLRAAAEGDVYSGEGHRVRGDGTLFWANVTLLAIRDDAGRPMGFAKITRDLTQQRAAESAVREAGEQAEEARRRSEEASQAKSLFLATMSHEIRTPLNAIMGYSDLLDLEIAGRLNDQQRLHVDRIRQSSRHLLGLVENVLDLSRVEAGRLVADRRLLRTDAVMQAALTLVAPQAADRGVALTDAVTGLAAGSAFWGDDERVRQILVNLLSNAIKFTPTGGRITISTGSATKTPAGSGLEGPGPWVYIRVEDTGPGIPADQIEPIFEPFVQVDMTHTRQYGGTGLGLSISRRLARLMGGDLTAHSEVGLGSTFLLWLPAAAGAEAAAAEGTGGETRHLHDLHDVILADIERILFAFVARLRTDAGTEAAHGVDERVLENHLASYLADVANTLKGLGSSSPDAAAELLDGTAIQHAIAERHGQQRFRLGWSEAELVREQEILIEEILAAVRRAAGQQRLADLETATEALTAFLQRGTRVSLEAYRRLGRGG